MNHGFGRLSGFSLAIAVIDQYCLATCSVAGINITPAIPHHKTASQIDIMPASSLEKKAWTGFAASTLIRIIMITDEDVVDGKFRCELLVHGINFGTSKIAAGNIRLVRDDVERETMLLEFLESGSCAWQNFKMMQSWWRQWFAISKHRAIEDAIAIEKNGRAWLPTGAIS